MHPAQSLGPLLFRVYINDFPDSVQSTVRLFAVDTIIYQNIRITADQDILQADLNAL